MTDLVNCIIKHMDKEKSKLLCKTNINTLNQFDEHNISLNLSVITRESQLRTLILLTRIVTKSFRKITKQDINIYFKRLSTDNAIKVKPYTREQRRAVICKFFRWLYKRKKYEKAPNVIQGILEPIRNAYNKKLDINDLWTDEEVKKLVKFCTHSRDSALIMTLYDSGARISEILSMNIKDVQFEGDACFINIRDSKTEERRVGMIIATPYLQCWIEHHPLRDNPNAPLFISFAPKSRYKRIKQHSTFEILQKIKTRAGITKKLNHHLHFYRIQDNFQMDIFYR